MAFWSHHDITILSGFADTRDFSRELSRTDLSISPVGNSLQLRAPRYNDVSAAKALILGSLRKAGLSVERAAAFLRRINERELAIALDQVQPSQAWIAFALDGESDCAVGIDPIEASELLDKLGGAAFLIDLRGVTQ